MVEIGMVGAWVALWFEPRYARLNIFAIILTCVLLLGPILAAAVGENEESLQALLWAGAYLAVFVGIGAGVVAYRKRTVTPLTGFEATSLRRPPVAPQVLSAAKPIFKILIPILLVVGAVPFAFALINGRQFQISWVIFPIILALAPPAFYFLIVWSGAKLFDYLDKR